MAYNKSNYIKNVQRIVEIYNSIKEPDIPDTRIVRNIFPLHGVYICYRTWMYIKSMKPSEYKQPTLFD